MEVNITDISLNAANIVNGLDFVINCTAAMHCYGVHNPTQYFNVCTAESCISAVNFFFKPYDNSTLNLDFLQEALPPVYQDRSAVISILQEEMSSLWTPGSNFFWNTAPYNWAFIDVAWYQRALWSIY